MLFKKVFVPVYFSFFAMVFLAARVNFSFYLIFLFTSILRMKVYLECECVCCVYSIKTPYPLVRLGRRGMC